MTLWPAEDAITTLPFSTSDVHLATAALCERACDGGQDGADCPALLIRCREAMQGPLTGCQYTLTPGASGGRQDGGDSGCTGQTMQCSQSAISSQVTTVGV